jgi:SAM-dependent methyltransferase
MNPREPRNLSHMPDPVSALPDPASEIRRAYARRTELGLDARYTPWDVGSLFRYQERERAILKLLDRHGFKPLNGVRILDVGCGGGGTLRDLITYGASPDNLAGVDLLGERIAQARHLAPHLDFRIASAADLPFENDSFDLALAFTIFSSIKDAVVRKAVADEILRVVRPGGALLWYDFWTNPVNADVEALGLGEVRRLFGQEPLEAQRVTLAPPLARLLAPRSWLACELLRKIPLLRTHWLALVRVP